VHRFGNLRNGCSQSAPARPIELAVSLGRAARSLDIGKIPFDVRIGRRVEIHHHSGIVINGYVGRRESSPPDRRLIAA